MAKTRKLVSYKEAKEKNLPKYYTGVPCANKHLSPRFTCNNKCVDCTNGPYAIQEQLAAMARNHKAIMDASNLTENS